MSNAMAGGGLSGNAVGATTANGGPGMYFVVAKRLFDVGGSLLLLPLLGIFCVLLLVLNPFGNPGALFFRQVRMGEGAQPFTAWKFRTMSAEEAATRGADDPLETDRITKLGRILRESRVDELPQILNVLRGEMSLIGPRPDMYEHALAYFEAVPGYRNRVKMRPGISGLAQTEVGYVEGADATRRKVAADLYYMANRSLRLEAWILWRTISVVVRRAGI